MKVILFGTIMLKIRDSDEKTFVEKFYHLMNTIIDKSATDEFKIVLYGKCACCTC